MLVLKLKRDEVVIVWKLLDYYIRVQRNLGQTVEKSLWDLFNKLDTELRNREDG